MTASSAAAICIYLFIQTDFWGSLKIRDLKKKFTK